jgi:hypothetical protein
VTSPRICGGCLDGRAVEHQADFPARGVSEWWEAGEDRELRQHTRDLESGKWCGWCGAPIVGRAQRARYCSQSCSRASWREREREQRAALRALDRCVYCDGSMAGRNRDAVYCSRDCKREVKKARNRIRLQTPATCGTCGEPLVGLRADCRAHPGRCHRRLVYAENRELYLQRRREKRQAAKVLELSRVPDALPLVA